MNLIVARLDFKLRVLRLSEGKIWEVFKQLIFIAVVFKQFQTGMTLPWNKLKQLSLNEFVTDIVAFAVFQFWLDHLGQIFDVGMESFDFVERNPESDSFDVQLDFHFCEFFYGFGNHQQDIAPCWFWLEVLIIAL